MLRLEGNGSLNGAKQKKKKRGEKKKNVKGAEVEEKGDEVTGGRHAVGRIPAVAIWGRSRGLQVS